MKFASSQFLEKAGPVELPHEYSGKINLPLNPFL
jgi:hypothetical protein